MSYLRALTEDENPKPGGNFSLDGRADVLELIVHALNATDADAVGDVVVHEPMTDESMRPGW
jgi:hypothetical protein